MTSPRFFDPWAGNHFDIKTNIFMSEGFGGSQLLLPANKFRYSFIIFTTDFGLTIFPDTQVETGAGFPVPNTDILSFKDSDFPTLPGHEWYYDDAMLMMQITLVEVLYLSKGGVPSVGKTFNSEEPPELPQKPLPLESAPRRSSRLLQLASYLSSASLRRPRSG